MNHAVIDASAIVDVLLNVEAERLSTLLRGSRLHAPHLIDIEVLSALRRTRSLSEDDAAVTLDAYRTIPITRYEHLRLTNRIWHFRHNLSPYDAAYVALAEALEIPFVTRDLRLARAARDVVEVVTGSE